MPEATDKFKKVAPNTGWQIGGSGVDASVTTIPLVSATSLPTGTGIILTIDRVDSSGAQTPTKMERVVGVISGVNLISCVRGIGGTAQAHSAGAVVEIVIDSVLWNDLMDGILVEHNQDGTHKLAAITSAMQTWDGWVALGACTYETADAPTFQFSIASDVTGLLSPGMRIKLTQTTAKYFIVTAVGAFTGGKTIITVYGGTDYTLVNASITLPYFSSVKAPFGFPLNPLKWTVEAVTAGGIQVSPSAGTWYNKGGSLVVPIGSWKLSYAATIFAYGQVVTGNSQITAYSTLSKSASTEDDSSFTCNIDGVCYMAAFGQLLRSAVSAEKAVLLASKTTYYANVSIVQASTQQVGLAPTSTIIRAVCAYL
jgi:hypothetical protein